MNSVNSITWLKHYNDEFIKQVFPKLDNPHNPLADNLFNLEGPLTLYFFYN